MIKDINDACYSRGHMHASHCPLGESQVMRREIVIEENLSKKFEKVLCPIGTWDNAFTSGKVEVISSFNLHSEGGSFLFKDYFAQHIPKMLLFFKLRITFNECEPHTNFYTWNKICDILPSIIIELAYNKRGDSRFRLCLRHMRHLTDLNYADIRIRNVEVVSLTLISMKNSFCLVVQSTSIDEGC